MDTALARASVFGQRINIYTGTDYTGIAALRSQIITLESSVKDMHASVASAKDKYNEAHGQQVTSQKEVVGLLERKANWSAADLERYMLLIRSEHVNEQAVLAAREALAGKERELEEARTLLERLERKQYHEEQIWSDTIRRNSTWVTFGLMGVNIILLLASLAVFEPYRRRKIVREVRAALDAAHKPGARKGENAEEEVFIVGDDSVLESVQESSGESVAEILNEVTSATATSPEPETTAVLESEDPVNIPIDETDVAASTPTTLEETIPETPLSDQPAVAAVTPSSTTTLSQYLPSGAAQYLTQLSSALRLPDSWRPTLEAWQDTLRDLFSDRAVELKRVDVTTIALEGAATGVALMGLLIMLLRPR